VYIREAHPADGWQMESNKTEGVIFNQPTEWGERQSVAQACCTKLTLSIPCAVDTIENTVDDLYAAWPERIFVINREGKIAYAAKQGPWGFKPKEAESALRQLLRAHHRKGVTDYTQVKPR
jgi:Iodothyronine deiodinase